MAEVKVPAGKALGPCLIMPAIGGWILGRWDGQGWFDYDGSPIQPLFLSVLPSRAEFLDAVNYLAAACS